MKTVRKIITIDEEKCDGCGICANACVEGAIAIIDGKARLVSETYCDGLGACIGECPQGAITIEDRLADPFSEEAAKHHQASPAGIKQPVPCGCPGSAVRPFPSGRSTQRPQSSDTQASAGTVSELGSWPVQLMLVPPTAPFLKGADLLISADCAPFAVPDFHSRYLKGRIPLVGCPKLDDIDYYQQKLVAIFAMASPRSVTVLRMEVPCCGSLAKAVLAARNESAPSLPTEVHTIGIDGSIRIDAFGQTAESRDHGCYQGVG